MLALYIREDDTAATIWMRIVKSIHDTSVNRYRQLKIEITKLTPLDEPGQDIKEYTIKVRKIFEELTSARQFTWDLMVPVLRALEQVSVTKFTGFIPQIEENVNAGIMETAFMQPDDASAHMRGNGIHWETILEQMETRYESLFASNSWEPSVFNKGNIQGNALLQHGSTPQAQKGPCYHCGSTEHWANKCTEKSNVPGSVGSTSSGTPNPISWKSIPPAAGTSETVTRNDRTFYWCAKCNRGAGRWNASHKTTDHKGPTTNAANVSVPVELNPVVAPSINMVAQTAPNNGYSFSFL